VPIKQRFADATYWFYGRMRPKRAFRSAAEAGTAGDFAGLRGRKHALLVTFRRDGTAVPTTVWFGLIDDRRVVVHTEERTAKVRRIRRDPRARVIPSDPRGNPLGPGIEASARILAADEEREQAEAALDRNYGRIRRMYHKLVIDEAGMVYLELVPAAAAT
jgi:PPOX class probable F420-dependent enzyme